VLHNQADAAGARQRIITCYCAGQGLVLSGSISWLLFNIDGSLFSTTGSAMGLVTVQDGRCPPSTRRIMYVLITSLGSTTLTVTMLYYCFVAHKQRLQRKNAETTGSQSSSLLQPPPSRGSTLLRRRATGAQRIDKAVPVADTLTTTNKRVKPQSFGAKLRDLLGLAPSRTYTGLGDHGDSHTLVRDLDTVIDHLSPSHLITPTAQVVATVRSAGSIN
jgi:hypothetical protein